MCSHLTNAHCLQHGLEIGDVVEQNLDELRQLLAILTQEKRGRVEVLLL
jgi:hypothetical protein